MNTKSIVQKQLLNFVGTEASLDIRQAVENLNAYHAPTDQQVIALAKIRKATEQAMVTVLESCPPCEDRYDAIKLLREVRMKANSAIVLEGMI